EGHTDEVVCVIHSPNGRLIASGSRDATVTFCDGIDGKPWHIIAGHSDTITPIAFSPDSAFTVTGTEART
ncbi:MAG: hypothetical protein J3R72DRAFT_343691, partial [Linnemannia gamsii]